VTGAFKGRRVFLTGGSSGIGAALAKILVEDGAQVFLVARDEARLQSYARSLEPLASQSGGAVHFNRLDITQRTDIGPVVSQAREAMGGIDTLINNAGIGHVASFVDTPEAVFDALVATNYVGTVDVTRACLGDLLQADDALLITVCSLAAVAGIYGYTAYCSTKYAIRGFMDCLRQELLGTNVAVSVSYPGDVETPLLAHELQIRPPENQAIAGTVQPLAADVAARKILEGAARRQFEVFLDSQSKTVNRLMRFLPGASRWYMDRCIRRARG
jgi:short-subunit dehydrogenase